MENKYLKMFLIAAITNLITAAPQDRTENSNASKVPKIITRREWRAREARSSEPLPVSPAPYAVIHHGGIESYCFDQSTCSEIVRSYQKLHLDDRGWDDIGYNFIIGEDGNVYEGRGWDSVGAHAPRYNKQSIGICVIGDFTLRMPNDAALKALHALMKYGVTLGKLRKDHQVIGHRQTRATECPGETFYKYVKSLANWTERPVPYSDKLANSAEAENCLSR